MKKICTLFLTILLCSVTSLSVFATGGDGNVDGGGGGLGQGSSGSYWSPGSDGVRITVVNVASGAPASASIDLSNKAPAAGIYHFGKVSKLEYSAGAGLSPRRGGYAVVRPPIPLPRIVSTNGASNIAAIKQYFTSEFLVQLVANHTGLSYADLLSGQYKLLVEPLIYYKFEGVDITTTATEAALYDEKTAGLLRYRMIDLTHKNLPLSMFLERADLGYPAWTGSTGSRVNNAVIRLSLGLGIVSFTDRPQGNVSSVDYEYRTDTEVITAVTVNGGQSDPDNPVSVHFNILGTGYTVSNVFYPEGGSQLAWVKWTTPEIAQDVVINVSVTGGGAPQDTTIFCRIVDLDENPPPNPVADDRNDGFSLVSVPNRPEQSSASWSVWRPRWEADWQWESRIETVQTTVTVPALWRNPQSPSQTSSVAVRGWTYEPARTTTGTQQVERGEWVDKGKWVFDAEHFSASLSAEMQIYSDANNPTASGGTFKSGYGVRQTVSSGVSTSLGSAVSSTPNAVSYFPEFGYQSYWRLLQRMGGGNFAFKENSYSTYNSRVHFSPIWYPDGAYTVNTWLLDYWTPAGMLSANLTDTLIVRGNLWQDWHSAPR